MGVVASIITGGTIVTTGIMNFLTLLSKHTLSTQMSVGTHTALSNVAGLIVQAYDQFIEVDYNGEDPMPNGIGITLDNGLKPIFFSRDIMNRIANGTMSNEFVDAFVWWVNGANYHPVYIANQLLSPKRVANDLGQGSGEIVGSVNYYTDINIKPLKPAVDAYVAVTDTQRYFHDMSTEYIWSNWFYQKSDPITGAVTVVTGDDSTLASQIDDMIVGDLFEMYGTFLIVSALASMLRPFPKLIAYILEKVFGVAFESDTEKILAELTSEDDDRKIEPRS